jgi:hypothetical protein
MNAAERIAYMLRIVDNWLKTYYHGVSLSKSYVDSNIASSMEFGDRGGRGRERIGPRAWRYGTVGAEMASFSTTSP